MISHEALLTLADRAAHPEPGVRDPIAAALRDGVLQDLLAVSMLLSAASARVGGKGAEPLHALLGDARETLQNDLAILRALIAALDAADRPAALSASAARAR